MPNLSAAARRRRAERREQATRFAVPRPLANTRLAELLPRNGMVYGLLKERSGDEKVARVIKTSWASALEVPVGTLSLTKSIVDKALASIFAAATELTEEMIKSDEMNENTETMVFLNKLKFRVGTVPVVVPGGGASMGVGAWARALPSEMFYKIFMILRASRRYWYENPRQPMAVEEHCALARNIDRFFDVDMLNWGDFAMVQWVTRGGLGDVGVGLEAAQDEEAVDILVEEEEEEDVEGSGNAMEIDASDVSPKLLTGDEVKEMLARVCVDVDQAVLEAAFDKLHL
ncbi:hypothetical protein QBC40DRAFT_309305 [Triangularia verruculosa]|uniref:Uncharacterized protein n=1 Tax=Triangularia verruculosa TaxID=2587418 RepID=A0AAN7ATP3_9PEZI|nr:hypothetical protein QBC40DRAFT_309305 [Triangularia verruculosa]